MDLIDKYLPQIFFADLNSVERLKTLVKSWQRAIKINQEFEMKNSKIYAEFENLLIDIMGSRKCSVGSFENYYEPKLNVERINKLYSMLQKPFIDE